MQSRIKKKQSEQKELKKKQSEQKELKNEELEIKVLKNMEIKDKESEDKKQYHNELNNKKLKDKLVLIIIPNTDDDDILAIADNLEFKDNVVFISDNKKIAKNKEAKKYNIINDSFQDSDEIIKKITAFSLKNKKKICGIIGFDEEFRYVFSERIANHFRLDYPKREVLDIASNKFLQRTALKKAGVNVPEFKLLCDLSWGKNSRGNNCDTLLSSANEIPLTFPNVLKHINGYTSALIYLNEDKVQFAKNLSIIKNKFEEAHKKIKDPIFVPHVVSNKANGKNNTIYFDFNRQYMVEGYVPGVEYSCDFMVLNKDKAKVLRIIRKYNSSKYFGLFDGFLLFNPDSPDNSKNSEFKLNELELVCSKIAKAYGVHTGKCICMVDFKFSDGKIVVLEATVRPGLSTFIELMGAVYGDISVNKLIRKNLGLNFSTKIPEENGMVVYFLAPSSGTLKKFDTTELEKNKKKLGIIKISKYHGEGTRIRKNIIYNYFEFLMGHALLKNVSVKSAPVVIDNLRRMVKVNVVPFKKTK